MSRNSSVVNSICMGYTGSVSANGDTVSFDENETVKTKNKKLFEALESEKSRREALVRSSHGSNVN